MAGERDLVTKVVSQQCPTKRDAQRNISILKMLREKQRAGSAASLTRQLSSLGFVGAILHSRSLPIPRIDESVPATSLVGVHLGLLHEGLFHTDTTSLTRPLQVRGVIVLELCR